MWPGWNIGLRRVRALYCHRTFSFLWRDNLYAPQKAPGCRRDGDGVTLPSGESQVPRKLLVDNWDDYRDRLEGFEYVAKCYTVLVLRQTKRRKLDNLEEIMRGVLKDAWEWRLANVKNGESRVKGITILIQRPHGQQLEYLWTRDGFKQFDGNEAVPR